MEDPQSAVQVFEMEQSLEMDESSGEAAATVAASEWDSDFVKHAVEGGLEADAHQRANTTTVMERTINLSETVPNTFEVNEACETLANLATKEEFFAPMTQTEERALAKSVSLADVLKASPAYLAARDAFVRAATESNRSFEKRASGGSDEPCACKMGIRCGEGTSRVEKTESGWIMEYDSAGQLMRAYDSRA